MRKNRIRKQSFHRNKSQIISLSRAKKSNLPLRMNKYWSVSLMTATSMNLKKSSSLSYDVNSLWRGGMSNRVIL